jgi:hypothetical protein
MGWDGMGRKFLKNIPSHGMVWRMSTPWDDFLRPIASHAEPWYIPSLSWDFSFPVLLSLFRWTYSNYLTLVVCYRYAFLFAFINSSKPQSTHYSIYSCCFFSMYENMASGISFEINCLYTTTLYGTNRGEVKNEMTLEKKQW